MTQMTHLSDFLRDGNICHLSYLGRHTRIMLAYQMEVSKELEISQNVISSFWQRVQDDGNVSRRYGTGLFRVTTLNDDQYLTIIAYRSRRNPL